MIRIYSLFVIPFLLIQSFFLHAHHNPIAYNGKQEVRITGTVTHAKFGYPHSRYVIDVKNDRGETEEWVLMTEDPRDAENLGFADELRQIKRGDQITVVGWPNRFKKREIRGHQLHYPDGTVVMMRRGNYIWNSDMRRIFRLRSGRDEFPADMKVIDPSLPPEDRLIAMIEEDRMVERIAFEIASNTAYLFGFIDVDKVDYPGVDTLMMCHTERAGFTVILDYDNMTEQKGGRIYNSGFVRRYNATLSRYWEQDVESC